LNLATIGVQILLVVSGVYLITSLIRIRSFLNKNNASDVIDIRTMLLHAGAFGLFLVSDIILLAGNVVKAIWVTNPAVNEAFFFALDFYLLASFVS
jgi:hypothetical protein